MKFSSHLLIVAGVVVLVVAAISILFVLMCKAAIDKETVQAVRDFEDFPG